MITLVSKWNGRNYYGYHPDGSIVEYIKRKGAFYQLKYKHWELTAVWDALQKSDFTLVEEEEDEEEL